MNKLVRSAAQTVGREHTHPSLPLRNCTLMALRGPLALSPKCQPSSTPCPVLAFAVPALHGVHCVTYLSCDSLSPALSGHQGDSDWSALFFERPAPGPALGPETQRALSESLGTNATQTQCEGDTDPGLTPSTILQKQEARALPAAPICAKCSGLRNKRQRRARGAWAAQKFTVSQLWRLESRERGSAGRLPEPGCLAFGCLPPVPSPVSCVSVS